MTHAEGGNGTHRLGVSTEAHYIIGHRDWLVIAGAQALGYTDCDRLLLQFAQSIHEWTDQVGQIFLAHLTFRTL
jgi:hypothetical protein